MARVATDTGMTDPTTAALARATPRRRERDVQRAVLAALRAHGWIAYPVNRERAGRTRASHIGVKGISDVMGFAWHVPGVRAGTVLAVEVKRPGQRPTREQQAWLDLVNGAQGVACWATSVDEVGAALGWTTSKAARGGSV